MKGLQAPHSPVPVHSTAREGGQAARPLPPGSHICRSCCQGGKALTWRSALERRCWAPGLDACTF